MTDRRVFSPMLIDELGELFLWVGAFILRMIRRVLFLPLIIIGHIYFWSKHYFHYGYALAEYLEEIEK